MKKILYILVILILSACNNDIHWHTYRRTATGKHSYYIPAWGAQTSCKTYVQLPTRTSYYRSHYYFKPYRK